MKRPEHLIPAPPVGPGDFLREQFLVGLKLTQEQLADSMQVSRLSVNQIVNGRRAVTAEMALRLARVTSTTPDLWLNLQQDVDIHEAQQKLSASLSQLKVLRKPKIKKDLVVDVQQEKIDESHC